MTWRIEQPRATALSDKAHFAVWLPQAVRPETIGDYLTPWHAVPRAQVRLDIEVPRADHLPHGARVDDLVLRMLYARRAGAEVQTLTRPWTATHDRHLTLVPDPLLGIFANTAHRLGDGAVLDDLPLGRGLRGMIVHGTQGGMIVAWNESARDDQADLRMYLGRDPRVIDVWGNRSRPVLENGRHLVTLGRTPVFIEGINTQLALFRAAFSIDEPFLESVQTRQRRVLTIRNPWPQTITGQMRIDHPEDWRVEPRIKHFSIPSGATTQVPINIHFPVSETAGDKKLIASFQFIADREYQVDGFLNVEVGLRHVKFDASLALAPDPATGRSQAIVTEVITNTSDKPVSLFVFADLPGVERKERAVALLLPGQTAIRRFTFNGLDAANRRLQVRVGLREANGPAALNMILEPDP